MFKLLHAQNLLEHIEKLFLGQDALAIERLHARRPLVFVVAWSDKQLNVEFRPPIRGNQTHPFPSRYNRTSPSKRSAPFPCSVHRFPEATAPAFRCCCETLHGSRTVSRLRWRPSSGRDPTSGTHRGTTEQHSGTLRPPWFVSRLSWRPESDSLSCRDSVWWSFAAALSCRWAACYWTDTRCNVTRKRKAEFVACVLPPQSCAARRAPRDLSAARWRATVKVTLDVVAADFEGSPHFVMYALAMRGKGCGWNVNKTLM